MLSPQPNIRPPPCCYVANGGTWPGVAKSSGPRRPAGESGGFAGAPLGRQRYGLGGGARRAPRRAGQLQEARQAIRLAAHVGGALGEIAAALVVQPRLEPAGGKVLAGHVRHRAAGRQEVLDRVGRAIGGGEVIRSGHRLQYRPSLPLLQAQTHHRLDAFESASRVESHSRSKAALSSKYFNDIGPHGSEATHYSLP